MPARPGDKESDATLIQLSKEGDARAFSLLVERYYSSVYATAYASLRHRESAEELAQEAFLRAHLQLSKLQSPEHFAAWVHRIARNLAVDWLRRDHWHSELLQMVPLENTYGDALADRRQTTPREQLASLEENKRLREAILQLPDSLREVVLLHYVEDLTKAEIAQRTGLARSSVGRRLERALELLRREFGVNTGAMAADASQAVRPSPAALAKATAIALAVGALPRASRAALLSATANTPAPGFAFAQTALSGATKMFTIKLAAAAGLFGAALAGLTHNANSSHAVVSAPVVQESRKNAHSHARTSLATPSEAASSKGKEKSAPAEARAASQAAPKKLRDEGKHSSAAQTGAFSKTIADAPISNALAPAPPTTAPLVGFTGDLVIESRKEGKNSQLYCDWGPGWHDNLKSADAAKSTASGLTPKEQCGSRELSPSRNQQTRALGARFTLNLASAERGFVYLTWPKIANATPVLATVCHADGVDTVTLSQDGDGEQSCPNGNLWVPLGEYRFGSGPNQYVELDFADSIVPPNPRRAPLLYADALRFVRTALPEEETTGVVERVDRVMMESARQAARKGLESRDSHLAMPLGPDGQPWHNADRWAKWYVRFVDKPGTISGRVVDEKGRPVAEAGVLAELCMNAGPYYVSGQELTAQTDSQGRFSVAQIPLGPWQLRVIKSGYAAGKMTIVQLSAEQPQANAELQVHRGAFVAGTVLGEDERPVAGVRVGTSALTQRNGAMLFIGSQEESLTDEAGRFSIDVDQEGSYNLLVEPAGGYAKMIAYDVPVRTKDHYIRLKRGASVSGRVVTIDSTSGEKRSVADANVFAEGSNREAYCSLGDAVKAKTDANGRFRLENLCTEERHMNGPGSRSPVLRQWTIICQDVQKQVSPAEGSELGDIELAVKDTRPWVDKMWTLRGKVVDVETSKPLYPFRVSRRATWDTSSIVRFFSDQNSVKAPGSYEIMLEPQWGVQLKIEADGYEPVISPILYGRQSEQSFDVALKPTAGLLGVVSTKQGKRVAKAQVVLYQSSDSVFIENGRPQRLSGVFAETDAQGHFVLPSQPNDRYIVKAFADEGFAEVSAAQLRQNPEVVLTPWARVEGECCIATVPQSGRQMYLRSAGFEREDTRQANRTIWSYCVGTDSQGRFVFERVLPAGSGKVITADTNSSTAKSLISPEVELHSGQTSRVKIQLSPANDKQSTASK